MEKTLNELNVFFTQSPQYIYFIIGVVFSVLFYGALKDKKWAIDPESGQQRFFYNTFGHKAFRIIVGVIYFLGIIVGFGMMLLFYYSKYEKL